MTDRIQTWAEAMSEEQAVEAPSRDWGDQLQPTQSWAEAMRGESRAGTDDDEKWWESGTEKYLPLSEREAWIAQNVPLGPELLGVGAAAASLFPMGKFVVFDSYRDYVTSLPAGQQAKIYALEGVGLALPYLAKPLKKVLGKGLTKAAGNISPKLKFQPVAKLPEVAPGKKWVQYNYADAAQSKIARMKFADDELDAINSALTGDMSKLKPVVMQKLAREENPSKAFRYATNWVKEAPETSELILSQKFMADMAEPNLMQNYIKRQFISGVMKTGATATKTGGKGISEKPLDAALQSELTKYMPRSVATKATLGNASEEMVANAFTSMLKDPRKVESAMGTSRGLISSLLYMIPDVFGSGEVLLKTKSMIYDKISDAYKLSRKMTAVTLEDWMKRVESVGLGKVHYNTFGAPNLKPIYARADIKEATKHIVAVDNLIQSAKSGVAGGMPIEAAREAVKQATLNLEKINPVAAKMVSLWDDFADDLYGEYANFQYGRVFSKVMGKTTTLGRKQIAALQKNAAIEFESVFRSGSKLTYVEKFQRLNKVLDDTRLALQPLPDGTHTWFQGQKNQITSILDDLTNQFSLGGKGAANPKGEWLDYVENYMAHIGAKERQSQTRIANLLSDEKRNAFFIKNRTASGYTKDLDLNDMIVARVSAQYKDMILYDAIADAAGYAKQLPKEWGDKTEWLISRTLGLAGPGDEAWAKFLQKTVGKIEHAVGAKSGGLWDANRVQALGASVRDLTSLSIFAFRGFSALRNYAQYVTNVPGALGGMKDFYHLAKGIGKAAIPENRQYLQRIGVITDFMPELSSTFKPLPMGAINVGGKTISMPSIERVRDLSMWMFQGSDRHLRYMTGGAAMSKWDDMMAKFGGKLDDADTVTKFMKESKANLRGDYVAAAIEDSLLRKRYDLAKEIYIKDIVKDSQYLYGKLEQPAILTAGGETTRTLLMFQSWWMNYGTMLTKWATTGTADEISERMFTWMFSAALAQTALEKMWGGDIGRRTVGLGPFPRSLQDVTSPPVIDTIEKGVKATMALGDIALGADPRIGKRAVMDFIESGKLFVPMGLQLSETYKATKQGGAKGALLSLAGLEKRNKPGQRNFFNPRSIERNLKKIPQLIEDIGPEGWSIDK